MFQSSVSEQLQGKNTINTFCCIISHCYASAFCLVIIFRTQFTVDFRFVEMILLDKYLAHMHSAPRWRRDSVSSRYTIVVTFDSRVPCANNGPVGCWDQSIPGSPSSHHGLQSHNPYRILKQRSLHFLKIARYISIKVMYCTSEVLHLRHWKHYWLNLYWQIK